MYFRDLIRNAKQNQACLRAELGDKTISPVASFVLGIHFTNTSFCDSAPYIPTTARLNRGGGQCCGGYAYGIQGECPSAHVAAFVRRALFSVWCFPVAFRALGTLLEASMPF